MRGTTIVVGVTTYANPPDQLERLARSCRLAAAELPAECEIALACVDNHGDPGLALCTPAATVLEPQGNVGFAVSTNRLMRHAFEDLHAQAFLCANPDGAFHHRALAALLEFNRRFPTALIEALQFPEEHPKEYDPLQFDTPWCSACCLLVPRAVYEAIGPFDPGFFLYMEDVDFSWRARLGGFSTKVCPAALFAHDVRDRGGDPLVERRQLESGRRLAWKWHMEEFQLHCEKLLLSRKFFRSPQELPALPADEGRIPPAAAARVARFDRNFAFAGCRW